MSLVRRTTKGSAITYAEYDAVVDAIANVTGESYTLTGTFNDIKTKGPIIDVRAYGAVGDGSTDDTTSIQSAATYAASVGSVYSPAVLYFPGNGLTYKTTNTISIGRYVSVIMDGIVVYSGTDNEAALSIGGTSTQTNYARTHKIKVRRSSVSDWSNVSCIGVNFLNPIATEIHIDTVEGFTVGAQITGDGAGAAYNNIHLGFLDDNKYGLRLHALDGSGSGWVNENKFFGGRFNTNTSTNTGEAAYGVWISSADAYYNNGNIFYGPSFELKLSGASRSEAVPILIDYGNQNIFKDCRQEFNSTTFARVDNNSSSNEFFVRVMSGSATVDEQGSYPSSVLHIQDMAEQERPFLVFDSGPLARKSNYYDTTTSIYTPGLAYGGSGSAALSVVGTGSIKDNYIDLSSSNTIGIYIDTSVAKSFFVKINSVTGRGGRIGVQCYDSTGTVLTSAGAGHPYVTGKSTNSPTWTASYGGLYRTGNDGATDFYFRVGADVNYIRLVFMGGTATMQLKSFQVYTTTPDQNITTWSGLEDLQGGAYASVAPVKGPFQFRKGARITNYTVTAGGIAGWICTTAGYAVKEAWTSGNSYTADDYTSNAGKIYRAVNSGTAGATPPTHTSGDVSDGTVTWTYIATSAVAVFTPERYARYETYGSAVVADNSNIAHGMSVTPTVATVTSNTANVIAYVGSINATNIVVGLKNRADGSAGASQLVYWRATK